MSVLCVSENIKGPTVTIFGLIRKNRKAVLPVKVNKMKKRWVKMRNRISIARFMLTYGGVFRILLNS